MNFSLKALLSTLAIGAMLTTGCVVEPGPTDTCNTNIANLTVKDLAGETIDIVVSGGPTGVSYTMYGGDTRTDSLVEGTYRVQAFGVTTGLILSDSTSYFACDASYRLDLTPAQPPIGDPDFAELDISDDTGENLEIYIDGTYQNTLYPGETAQYMMGQGDHYVEVIQEDTGFSLMAQTDFYAANTVTTFSIISDYPQVEVNNDLFGLDAECVNTFVDGDAVQFDTLFYDVCPTETGYFAVYHGDHQLEVFGQDSSFQYIDLFQHFPENTTTVINIQ